MKRATRTTRLWLWIARGGVSSFRDHPELRLAFIPLGADYRKPLGPSAAPRLPVQLSPFGLVGPAAGERVRQLCWNS